MDRDNRTIVKNLAIAAKRLELDHDSTVLAVGASELDVELLRAIGFSKIVTSNLDGFQGHQPLDLEELALADESYDIVFAHAVLHHCRSPHKAAGEMARVCRRCAIFIEPNESTLMRILTLFRFSFPYEIGAVSTNNYVRGGMRNGPIPNFIYRWNPNELLKTISTYVPERVWSQESRSYWDFFITEIDLKWRKQTRLGGISDFIGPSRFIYLLQLLQKLMNTVPIIRSQGNKFMGVAVKGRHHPWIDFSHGEPRLAKKPELYGEPIYF